VRRVHTCPSILPYEVIPFQRKMAFYNIASMDSPDSERIMVT